MPSIIGKYHVAYPNALWHIDGNMSFIRWGFVVHGAVDGHSWLIVYLHCPSNNRAQCYVYSCKLEKGMAIHQEYVLTKEEKTWM